MQFIDTHSHMYLSDFAGDLDACMQRALEAGVVLTALPNVDLRTVESLRALHEAYPAQTLPMMGLHPCSVGPKWREELHAIHTELLSGHYIAIGEIGIDLYWDKTYQREQEDAFAIQIGWAKELGLPIVIHARESFREICTVLDSLCDERLTGVFHCFTGSVNDARKALSYPGFYLGIGGVLTFKKSGLDAVLSQIGIGRVVLETDAPYLAPTPFRGKRNETVYTRLVAERMAEVTGLTLAEVAATTTRNALQLFKLNA